MVMMVMQKLATGLLRVIGSAALALATRLDQRGSDSSDGLAPEQVSLQDPLTPEAEAMIWHAPTRTAEPPKRKPLEGSAEERYVEALRQRNMH